MREGFEGAGGLGRVRTIPEGGKRCQSRMKNFLRAFPCPGQGLSEGLGRAAAQRVHWPLGFPYQLTSAMSSAFSVFLGEGGQQRPRGPSLRLGGPGCV